MEQRAVVRERPHRCNQDPVMSGARSVRLTGHLLTVLSWYVQEKLFLTFYCTLYL